MYSVEFRSYEEADVPYLPGLFTRAIQTVYPELEEGPWLEDLYHPETAYNNGGDILVGIHSDVIVAMGGIKRINDETGELKRVATEPQMQGQGLGGRLLTAMEERACALGIRKLVLDTTLGQVGARRLYDKRGYELADRHIVTHPTGKQFDTFFYAKVLS